MVEPNLTLKEGSKFKFDLIKKFAGHDFLQGHQTSRTNNKQAIGTFKMVDPQLDLEGGVKGQIWPHQKIRRT